MSTFREVVYMVLDSNKLSNDDSYVEPEHVLYIISKLRAYLLTSKYQKMKAQVSNSNFQTITLDLEPADTMCGCSKGESYMLRSKSEVPDVLLLNNYEGLTSINPVGTFGCETNFTFVNATRFNVVGYNKWLASQTYVTIGPDNRVYIKSSNSDILELEEIQISAVFEDAEKAANLIAERNAQDECAAEDAVCDVMDSKFPLEEGLIALLIDNATNIIYNMASKSKDDKNSSSDELNNIMNYINTMMKDKYRRSANTLDNE